MSRRTSRTPSLEEVISSAIEYRLDDLHVALPGVVEEYNSKEQKARVKPLLKRNIITPSGAELTPESLPILTDVPVMFPRSGDFFISFPVKKGDHVLLVFCERSLDIFMTGTGGETNPIDLRMHHLADAVAYPGLYPFPQSLNDASPDDMVIGKDNDISMKIRETEVEFHTDGSDKQSMTIAERLQDLYEKVKGIKQTFDTHLHATGVGPSGPPQTQADGLVTFPEWESDINSNKVKLPKN